MRIVITGSSGLIGRALLPALRAAGHEAIPVVRRPPNQGEIRWDPASGMLERSALEGIDGAINLAGENIATRWTDESKRKIRESRITGTRLLAETMARLATRPRVLVSVSAIGYYGDRDEELLTEESAPGQGFLPQLGQEWEASAQPARAAGIRVVHPRLGIVLSSEGGALKKMLLPFKLGIGGRFGSGEQWMSWIAIDDVIGGLLFLLGTDAPSGPVNFAAPGAVRNKEFTRRLGEFLHRPTFFPTPSAALYLLYGREMPEEALLASARVVPRRLLDTGFQFRLPELEPALKHVLNR
jgi:uncharacterized protein (TIGR01777 family)